MVSIVLVTYNRHKRLSLSIQDILNQTFRDFELIICDDCSTDGTEYLCQEYARQDSRIRYFRHSANKRMPANLNFGIQQARFEYVAILHDGDRFRMDLIEQWYRALSSHDDVGFVFNSTGDSDPDENIVKVYSEFPEGVVKRSTLLKKVYFRRPHFDSPVYGEAMVRKSLVQRYGYLKEDYGFYADVDLWMHCLQHYDAYYCADTLIKTPLKSFQPQLFEDDTVRYNVYLFNMHHKQRRLAFEGKPLRKFMEMCLFYAHTIFQMTFCLLIVVKNYSFDYFMRSRHVLKKTAWLLPVWAGLLIAYPLMRFLLNLMPRKNQPELTKELAVKSGFMFQR